MNPLEQFSQAVSRVQQTVETEFSGMDLAMLNYKRARDSWSILKCLEHLNRYSRYYNQALAKAMAQQPKGNYVQTIRYTWFGKMSLDTVRPQNSKRSKTLQRMNPNNSDLGHTTLQEFVKHQTDLLALLEQAKKTDLNRKAIPVEFFKLLKLRIGEALEFVIAHQERHVQQALRAKQQQLDRQVAA